MKSIHCVAFILLVVGGLNWLAVGVLGWDIGDLFGGQEAIVSRAIYVLVGLAAVYELFAHKARCKDCSVSGGGSTGGNM